MSAKTRKDSIYVMYEGYREGYFLKHLAGYSNVRFNPQPCNGGSANQIVTNGIKHSARDVNVYVFLDEDFQSKPGYAISDEALEGLENAWKINDTLKGCTYRDLQKMNKALKNPILVVSYPQSIEGFLLRLLGKPLQDLENKATQDLKRILASYFDNILLNDEDNEKIQGYDKKIEKYSDEIDKLQKNEHGNKKHRQFLEAKIRECGHNKKRVQFMRFLSEKLPLPVIASKRADVPEADILLKAFGL
jgi:molybdopterin converting factor small subunit